MDAELARLLPPSEQVCEDCHYWLPTCVCDGGDGIMPDEEQAKFPEEDQDDL